MVTDVVEATGSHVAAIAAFLREAWSMTGPGAPGWAGADPEVIEELTRPETLRERIGGPERRMFLARSGERVVGFAATRWSGTGPAELSGIVVLQEMAASGSRRRCWRQRSSGCEPMALPGCSSVPKPTTNAR